MPKPTFKRFPGEGKLLILSKQRNLPPLIVKMLKEVPHGITVTIDAAHKKSEVEGKLPNGFYSFEKDRIHLTHLDHHVLAHEMGHAQTDLEGALSRALQSKYLYPLHAVGPLAGWVGGAVLRDVKHPMAKAIAIGLPFLLTAPAMVAEAKASINGHKILEGLGASKEDLAAYRKKVAAYYLTYAASPALTGAALVAGKAST